MVFLPSFAKKYLVASVYFFTLLHKKHSYSCCFCRRLNKSYSTHVRLGFRLLKPAQDCAALFSENGILM